MGQFKVVVLAMERQQIIILVRDIIDVMMELIKRVVLVILLRPIIILEIVDITVRIPVNIKHQVCVVILV